MYGRRFLMDVPQEQRLWSLMTISHHLFLSTQHKGFHPVSPTLDRICDQVDTLTTLADSVGVSGRIPEVLASADILASATRIPGCIYCPLPRVPSGTGSVIPSVPGLPSFLFLIISTDRPPPSARCLRHRRLRPRQCKAPC